MAIQYPMDAEPSSGCPRSQNRPGMATVAPRASRWYPTPSAHRYRLARQGAAPTPGVAASHEKPVLSTLIRPSGHIPHAISTLLHADEAKTPQVVDLIMAERVGFVPVVHSPINDLGPIQRSQIAKSTQNLSIRYKTGTARNHDEAIHRTCLATSGLSNSRSKEPECVIVSRATLRELELREGLSRPSTSSEEASTA
jgi:hypothetical protein